MKYNKIRNLDISNGEGCGVSVFTQGCNIHCPHCFNKELWDNNGGKEWTSKEFNLICSYLDCDYIDHLTWLGGEPTLWAAAIADINRRIKDKYSDKKIWLYSGHTLEQLMSNLDTRDLLYTIDVLVDGPFIDRLKDTNLKFRGSSNQRIIDNNHGIFCIRK